MPQDDIIALPSSTLRIAPHEPLTFSSEKHASTLLNDREGYAKYVGCCIESLEASIYRIQDLEAKIALLEI
jgi:hypothetical protein